MRIQAELRPLTEGMGLMGRQNIVVADCEEEEVASFADGMNQLLNGFIIKSHIANWKRTGKFSELRRYGMYFFVGFKYFLNRRQYGILACWQQFYALTYCFFCELFHIQKCNTVIAINYTYKEKRGKSARLYRWFMGKCTSVKYLDYLHVLSDAYADQISREFSYPRERIIVTTFGVNDQYAIFSEMQAPEGYQKNGYALSIGRSNRDFEFLIRAWQGIDYPLVIISDTYPGKVNAPNVVLLKNVAGEESYPWIANCALMIIPIDDGSVCSGDTVLLTAMAVERKLLVTKPSTLAEMYILDGENAVLTEKDEAQFRVKVNSLLFSDEYENLGCRARKSFLNHFSRESMGKMVAESIAF